MLLRFREGDIRVDALIGASRIRMAANLVDMLRRQCGQSDELLCSVQHFLPRASIGHELPVAMLMYRVGVLFGVIFLQFRRKWGVPVGLVKAGNLMGQGSVVAVEADRARVAEVASRVLLRYPFAHTVILSVLFPSQTTVEFSRSVPGMNARWYFRDVRLRLNLDGGMDATMVRLGYKMRRNLRSSRRKAEDTLGYRFVADLSAAQREQAVAVLYHQGQYPTGAQRARNLDAMLLDTPGHFAMGLTNEAGMWLSYIAGWRGPLGTYVDWQLNGSASDGLSLSTLMRGYMIEHEIGRSSPAIVFVGGTSVIWSQVCDATVCGDLLATRKGVAGWVIRKIVCWWSPTGQVARLHRRSST